MRLLSSCRFYISSSALVAIFALIAFAYSLLLLYNFCKIFSLTESRRCSHCDLGGSRMIRSACLSGLAIVIGAPGADVDTV